MAYDHQINEHERPLARALWEQIFPEDTQAFLDAFFTLKGDNVILGVTEREAAGGVSGSDRLAAMIHLDPCSLVFGRRGADEAHVVRADYIVGVSTLPEYRHRGLMASLLREACARGAARKDPFLFLMPANEQVYLPFDFRTVYLQTNYLAADEAALTAAGRVAGPGDCAALAEAASRVLAESCDTYLVRDERYFRALIAEMAAEDGKVLCLPADDAGDAGDADDADDRKSFSGYLCFWPNDDGGALVRELVLPEPLRGVFLSAHGLRPAPEQPKIMVRPLDPAEFVKPLYSAVTRTFTLAYHDAILDMYDGVWTLTVGPEGGALTRADEAAGADAAACTAAPTNISRSGPSGTIRLPDMDPASLAEWVLGGHAPAGTESVLRPDRILINEWI